MTTNTQTTQTTGRNRGARKEQATENAKGNIGSHMKGKDQTPAVKTIAQRTEGKVNAPDKAMVTRAQAILHTFRGENDKLATLKQQLDSQRGGLSNVVFQVVLLGWNHVKNKADAWLYCKQLLDSAELAERVAVKKSKKLEDTPTAKEALGASWQTYKSQILKCLALGLDPTQYKDGTAYRSVASKIKPNKGRAARQTTAAGKAAAAATQTETDITELRTELSAAVVEFIKAMKALDEDEQLQYANQLHELTTTVGAGEQSDDVGEEAATSTM